MESWVVFTDIKSVRLCIFKTRLEASCVSSNTPCQLMGQIYRAAGLERAPSRSGRRWFTAQLAHFAVSPKLIMNLAGHGSLTTPQRYIDVRDDYMQRAAVELV